MDNLDTREWLLTNGLGSFASGTVGDARTRTYHGWLIAALNPPVERTLLLSHLDASLEVNGEVWALSSNFWQGGKVDLWGYQLLRSFTIEPVLSWTWGSDRWQLTRQLLMPHAFESQGVKEKSNNAHGEFCHRILIQYHYQGIETATLRLRPIIGDRNFHHQHSIEAGLQFSQLVGEQQICLQTIAPVSGTPWQLRWSNGNYQPEAAWYGNYYYPEEHQRGLGDREDLYSPGYLSVSLQPEEKLTLEARVGWPNPTLPHLNNWEFEQALQAEQERQQQLFTQFPHSPKPALQQLLRASDQFITHRASINGPTVIAGYPWFNDWGRDTLIALPGLALATGRFPLAKGLLETFGSFVQNGLIPNTFPDAGAQPIYNSIDASLWWIEVLGLYLEATQDWEFLAAQYPVVRQIYKGFSAGTLYNIHVDVSDGLLTWDAPNVAITWMDVVIDGEPVTPRRGKAIEINALWYSALCWLIQWTEHLVKDAGADAVRMQNQSRRYKQQAQQVKTSLQKFWNADLGYFFDVITPDDQLDSRLRPNAVLALSLHHCGFPAEQARRVLTVARDRLLTPYGLRSLDPAHPDYIGHYAGDRVHRDSAYHQGTVWSWLIGPFIASEKRFFPENAIAFDWQPLLAHLQQQACMGSISEIFDGDWPHLPQGAIAQAWSVAEILRYYSK
ncbi:MAG: amylo-alpha-1,6-glucosidase [Kastovskya adunca ATA6-11-RM4]|jgi:4-alpha-glucanotransferase|nr:amylo-alpha-1,6-glucosidase [Kastovskya adunca ATA6-11-RM4]